MNMIRDEIKNELFRLQDQAYRDFQSKLIPTVKPNAMIGVRTPGLRELAKQIVKNLFPLFFGFCFVYCR